MSNQKKIEDEKMDLPDRVDSDQKLVILNYPKPVMLSVVVEDVAEWSGFNFVMEPSLNKSIQIFAPHSMNKADGFNLFIASLETIGLRAVMLEGNLAKIVSHGLGKVSV